MHPNASHSCEKEAGLERGCRVSCDGEDAADGVEKAV
jgi:hypothetical protein